jgi:hypothetical protein
VARSPLASTGTLARDCRLRSIGQNTRAKVHGHAVREYIHKWSWSGNVTAEGWRKTFAASSKASRCFLRFGAALRDGYASFGIQWVEWRKRLGDASWFGSWIRLTGSGSFRRRCATSWVSRSIRRGSARSTKARRCCAASRKRSGRFAPMIRAGRFVQCTCTTWRRNLLASCISEEVDGGNRDSKAGTESDSSAASACGRDGRKERGLKCLNANSHPVRGTFLRT